MFWLNFSQELWCIFGLVFIDHATKINILNSNMSTVEPYVSLLIENIINEFYNLHQVLNNFSVECTFDQLDIGSTQPSRQSRNKEHTAHTCDRTHALNYYLSLLDCY